MCYVDSRFSHVGDISTVQRMQLCNYIAVVQNMASHENYLPVDQTTSI